MRHYLTIILSLLLLFAACKEQQEKQDVDMMLVLSNDFNRYENLYCFEVELLYKQIDQIQDNDSIKRELKLKALDIKKHSQTLINRLTGLVRENCQNHSIEMPTFLNYDLTDWKKLNREKFLESNQYSEKLAFDIKDELTSFYVHLKYINQKNIKSPELEKFLQNSIMIFDYIKYEPWENTLIVNKSTINLLITLNKIKFEVKMSEFMTLRYLLSELEKIK
jgi:hypothetical protein